MKSIHNPCDFSYLLSGLLCSINLSSASSICSPGKEMENTVSELSQTHTWVSYHYLVYSDPGSTKRASFNFGPLFQLPNFIGFIKETIKKKNIISTRSNTKGLENQIPMAPKKIKLTY
jgi:hypothetical protein